jgi:hypothetical protein
MEASIALAEACGDVAGQALAAREPSIICDKGSSAGLDRRRHLQRVRDFDAVACSQINSLPCHFHIDRQHPYLLRMEESLLVGLNQIEPALTLREHACLNQSHDRCHPCL